MPVPSLSVNTEQCRPLFHVTITINTRCIFLHHFLNVPACAECVNMNYFKIYNVIYNSPARSDLANVNNQQRLSVKETLDVSTP